MKKILLSITIGVLLCSAAISQHCGDNVVFAVSISFRANIGAEAKIGIWQNRSQGGFTSFAGVATDIKTQIIRKGTTQKEVPGFFFEIGYKKNLLPSVFIQALAGVAGSGGYLGGELLYRPERSNTLISIGYKRLQFEASIYFSF